MLKEYGYSVAFDEDRLPEPEAGYAGTDQTVTEEGEVTLPISAMSEVISGLMRLSGRLRDVVCLRYRGRRYFT